MFGVLAIDKPIGKTSRDVVNHVQRLIRPLKVGHTGTLDPLATGVLLLAVGRATRLVEFAHAMPKAYVGKFCLGQQSDTLDIEGEVVSLTDAPTPTRAQLEQACAAHTGEIEQTPPKYSALNINGRRAYDLARAGTAFEVPSRRVLIHHLKLQAFDFPEFEIEVTCSTGTYVRSLGADIARSLGSDAVMTELRRTAIGTFRVADTIGLEGLSSADDVRRHLTSPLRLLTEMASCTLSEDICRQLRHGIALREDQVDEPLPQATPFYVQDEAGGLVAILRGDVRSGYRSLRVFPNDQQAIQPSTTKTPQMPES